MNNHGHTTGTEPRNGRRLVLFPLPYQGHITPMLQLAEILYTKGFGITIIHTETNSPNHSNYPHFTFESISDQLFNSKDLSMSMDDIKLVITFLNQSCVAPFRDCLGKLLANGGSDEPTACLITDALWHFAQSVADEFKLPRIVLRTSSLANIRVYTKLDVLQEKGYSNISKQDPKFEAPIPDLPPLKGKDIAENLRVGSEDLCKLVSNMVKEMKAASGIIWNTSPELEQPELIAIGKEFSNPNFPIGPFHRYFPASSSSLMEQDRSFTSWLDQQSDKSVLYVSFGSIAQIHESELEEIAWGLANSMSPFLWVVRPGLVRGTEWLESLPKGFLEAVGNKGHIVKWAPQQEVLAHPAIGGFWTHSGWNSTLESICEGVPMICAPCFADQPINARYVAEVWKIGVQLENGLQREEIERAVKRIMTDEEGIEIRERIYHLKERVNLALKNDGSSYRYLQSLVNYILSL